MKYRERNLRYDPVMLRPSRLAWFLPVMGIVGCVSTASTLRKRFATEHGCPESRVDVQSATATQYRVSGCEDSTVYVCGSIARMNDDARDCVEEGGRPGPGDRDRERDRPVLPPPDPRVQAPMTR